jgi:hypothetical protein
MDTEDLAGILGDIGAEKAASLIEGLSGHDAMGGSIPGEFELTKGDWWDSKRGRIRVVQLYYRFKRDWRCAIVIGNTKLYDEVSFYRDEKGKTIHPYNAASCGIERDGTRYGVVKNMIPIQREINYRASKLTWLISARQTWYEEDAVDDINEFVRELAKPNAVLRLNPQAISGNKIKTEAIQTEIQGQAKLLESAMQQMMRYGPNSAVLGKGEGVDNASGRALLARQNAGMTEMAPVFDRHRRFKIAAYKRDWMLIKQFWDKQKFIRIVGDDGKVSGFFINEQEQPQNPFQRPRILNNVAMIDVDIVVEEGPDNQTMQEEVMDLLVKMGEAAMSPIGEALITMSGIRNKDHIISLLKQGQQKDSPEVEDMKRKMAHLEMVNAALEADKKHAEVENKRADSLVKLAGAGIPTQAMQVFPFDFGGNTFTEDVLGEQFQPNGNAFAFEPAPQMEQVPMTDGPPGPAGMDGKPQPGAPMPAMERRAPQHQLVPNRPQMPGEEPKLGAAGGMPLPNQAGQQAL